LTGAFVETNGLTSSVHFRDADPASHDEVKRIVHAQLANADHPFQLTDGKMVYDIRPRTSWNKGSALLWIKDQLRWPDAVIIYIGDDLSDEDAFVALAGQFTVGIGEKPDSSAAWYARDGAAVAALL